MGLAEVTESVPFRWFCSQTPDLEPLEPALEDVESINDFEPLFSEETPEVEKPVPTVQVGPL